MGGQMFGQIIGSCETFAAHFTMVWSFTSVNSQMARQVALAAERSATEQTDKRSFARVLSYMQLQILLRSNTFATERTGKSSFPLPFRCVHTQKTQDGRLLCTSASFRSCSGRSNASQRECNRIYRIVLIDPSNQTKKNHRIHLSE